MLKQVFGVFGLSLEPLQIRLDRHLAEGNAPGIRFECKRLQTAATHMGGTHLPAACYGITRYFDSPEYQTSSGRLEALVGKVMTEAVRVQRMVRQLVAA